MDNISKYGVFADLTKFSFYRNEVQFSEYLILAKKVKIQNKMIEVLKNWPKPKSI